jgi:DNA repair protein RadC
MSCVIADSRPESLTLIAAQHEDWIIQQPLTCWKKRIFKAGALLDSPAAVRDYLRLKLVVEPNEVFAVVFLDSQHQVLAYEPFVQGFSRPDLGVPAGWSSSAPWPSTRRR